MAKKNSVFLGIRYVFEWGLAVWLRFWLRILPRSWGIALLRPVVWLFWFGDRRHRRIVFDNIQSAFSDYSPDDIKTLAYKSYLNLARGIVDFVNLDKVTEDNWQARCSYRNAELVDELLAKGKGVILVTGHFGLWELNGQLGHLRWPPVTVIGRPLDNPYLNRYVFNQRQVNGATCLEKLGSVFPLMKILKRGHCIGVLLDQDGGRDGVYVKLFGRLCSTHFSMAYLSLRMDAPMVLVCGYYEDDGYHYTLWAMEEITLDERTGDDDVDLLRLVKKQNEAIERAVRAHPAQWLWMHKRFKRQPMVGSRILMDDGSVYVQTETDRIPLEEYRRLEKAKTATESKDGASAAVTEHGDSAHDDVFEDHDVAGNKAAESGGEAAGGGE